MQSPRESFEEASEAPQFSPSPFDSPNMSLSQSTSRPGTATQKSSNHPYESPNTHEAGQQAFGQDHVLAHFSFAPATTTTVVTTTTTTTTTFPPLVMKGPRHLQDLDPKEYPLASTPTPPSLKRFCFDVGGRPTIFHEADHAADSYKSYREQQNALQNSNGVLKQVTNFQTNYGTPSTTNLSGLNKNTKTTEMQASSTQREGSPAYSPVSLSRAAKTPGTRRTRERQASQVQASKVDKRRRRSFNASRLQICQTSTPMTPSLETRNSNAEGGENNNDHRLRPGFAEVSYTENPQSTTTVAPQTLSPRPERVGDDSFGLDEDYMSLDSVNPTDTPLDSSTIGDSQINYQATADGGFGLSDSTASIFRPRSAVLDTTASQDMSLPSPSLSPVTAAANLQNRTEYFDDLGIAVRRSSANADTRLSSFQDAAIQDTRMQSIASQSERGVSRSPARTSVNTKSHTTSFAPSMMDMPTMIDSFEAMPEEMKSYMLYQLLRRCSKPTLHFVADVVNPTLKCDFLSLLPFELSQHIVSHLDLKSLCRAAQVSKRWRHVIDSDEKTWKALFDADGFSLPPGELKRAILEGWGWQHASSNADYEEDIGRLDVMTPGRSPLAPSFGAHSSMGEPLDQGRPNLQRRSKRKVAIKLRSSSRKQPKRKEANTVAEAHFDYESLIKDLTTTDGPYAAANAALAAVPNPDVGLPSLQSMHLYKTLYRRHYMIRKAWMSEEVKPKHIAFRGHQRHVVTCLQFDSDKILTGSDDTNVNVYDTKTGALRAKLQGHEGGVWALQYVGNTLVSGSTDRAVRVWDIEKGECCQIFHGHTSTVRCLQILMPSKISVGPNGKAIMMPKQPLIITGSRDSHLRVWRLPSLSDPKVTTTPGATEDADNPYFVRCLTGHHHSVRAIAAHGDTLVSGSYDFTVRVWKISTGDTVHCLRGHNQKVYSVVLDHERNRCISGSMDNLVKVWDLVTGAILFNLEGHTSLVGLLDLQDGNLVSAAADMTLRVWDPETGRCKSTLAQHTGAITCFQHDGQKVVSGSDRALKMWDISKGAMVRDLLVDLSQVWQVKFDERRCVAAVQRNSLTYIEVLDFGAARDGVPASKRGHRILVNNTGLETLNLDDPTHAVDVDLVGDE